MANILTSLLPMLQQGGSMIPEAMGSDIDVLGRSRPAIPADDMGPMSLGNRAWIEEAMDARSKAPQRKGLFGVKGTLRDVLGAIGDHYLMGEGMKPVYAPKKAQEEASDALAGFTQNPMAALERLAAVNPELAQEMYERVSQGQARSQTAQLAGQKNQQEAFKEGSRLFGQYSGAIARDPKLATQLAPVMQRVRAMYGLPPEDFPIPGEQDVDLAAGFQYGGTPTQAQIADIRKGETIEQRERLETIKEEGRNQRTATQEAGRNRRDNPPAPKGISAVDAEVAEAVLSGKATPAQKRYYDERLKRGKKSRLGDIKPPPKAGGSSVFKVIRD